MYFEIHDQAAHRDFGIGRIISRATLTFGQAKQQDYYELAGPRSTIWVPVIQSQGLALRRLTGKADLVRCRAVLRSQPAATNADFRQRHLDVRRKAREGTLLAVCEVVRDLSAAGWHTPLNDRDANVLRRSRRALCEEWAAAQGVALADAIAEVSTLLQNGRQANRA